jgi:hypothetical protein
VADGVAEVLLRLLAAGSGCWGTADHEVAVRRKPGELVAELEIFSSKFFASLTQMSDAFDKT